MISLDPEIAVLKRLFTHNFCKRSRCLEENPVFLFLLHNLHSHRPLEYIWIEIQYIKYIQKINKYNKYNNNNSNYPGGSKLVLMFLINWQSFLNFDCVLLLIISLNFKTLILVKYLCSMHDSLLLWK
jgi:hypothetical protein